MAEGFDDDAFLERYVPAANLEARLLSLAVRVTPAVPAAPTVPLLFDHEPSLSMSDSVYVKPGSIADQRRDPTGSMGSIMTPEDLIALRMLELISICKERLAEKVQPPVYLTASRRLTERPPEPVIIMITDGPPIDEKPIDE